MPSRPAQQSTLTILLVAAAVCLAGVLRLADLVHRGFFLWDEAKFALEGIRMEQAVSLVFGLHADLAAGKPVGSAKPGHALLIAASYAIAGVRDYSPLFLNAVCSVCACAVLGLVGWRLFGKRVAVVAAGLLAVSEYDVFYARSGLSESDATLLFLIGVTLWLWPLPSSGRPATGTRLAMSALILGAAFSVNYRLIVYLCGVAAVDLVAALRLDGQGAALRRAALWVTGSAAVPLGWLVVGALAARHGTPLFFNEITAQPATYAAEVAYQLHEGKQSVVHFAPLVYGAWYVNRTGVAASVLLGVGFLWALLRPSFSRAACATLVALPYAVYTFAPFIVPRNLVAALPFAALLAADGLVRTARWKPPAGRPMLGILPVTLALTVIGASMSWRLTDERSGYAAAAAAVERLGGRALTSSEVMAFYLRRPGGTCSSPAVPVRLNVLAADIRAGYRLAVLERHHNSLVTDYIHRRGRLIASWPVFGGPNIGESPVASENGTWPNPHEPPEIVYLFDISNLPLRSRGHVQPEVCTLRVPI